ncbi:MAG: M20 family metallo-hydrolase [Bacteroidales bacterium]|nr:M20 family metallo-hydrolase [Bacteroidales bacterium]MCD8395401.1 M20 family metallo-hydrolase [Bacteroidales bacterium]
MIDQLYYQAVDLLKELIATPRVSREETAAADIVERFLKDNGCQPQRLGNNIIVKSDDWDPQRPTLLLNSHIDTVKPVAGWTRDPHSPYIDSETERLYGLGSNDAGASLVSLIATYLYMREQPCAYNLVLVASAEEEVSGKNGLESVIPHLPPISVAIVGEPTGMNPAVAEKGLMVLDGVVKGISGHAARNEGVNAIYKAMGVVDTLRSLKFPKESAYLGPVKITVTGINAGTQHNVVPDKCTLMVDVRTTDAYSNVETLELIRKAVPEAELTPRSTRLNPSRIDHAHPIVQRSIMLGGEAYGSPTLSDQALMPWPSVKMGPGDSARSHTADEYILLPEIRDAITRYTHILSA